MSAAQFHAAGLDKLSADELAQLNSWLREHAGVTSAAAAAAAVPDRTGFHVDNTGSEFSTRVIGEFRGWSGKTTFHLDNGQVWQQVGHDSWGGVNLENPTIVIRPAFMGSWLLKVEGYNASTRVKRIK